jgi:predicted RNA-binding Zn ribbon-like protein
VTDAGLIVALANAQAARRPAYARNAVRRDALADARAATELLEPFLGLPVTAGELPAVRGVARTVMAIVDAMINGLKPSLDELNGLAAREPLVLTLGFDSDHRLRATLRPRPESATAALLVAVIRELEELDRSRLRRCARPECTLAFYDTTRSGTQRWHAENPCGSQQRQRRHRLKSAAGADPAL